MVVSYPSTCGSVASPVTKSSVLKYQVTVGQLFRSQVKLAKRILFSLCLSLCIFLKINSMYSAAVKLLNIFKAFSLSQLPKNTRHGVFYIELSLCTLKN